MSSARVLAVDSANGRSSLALLQGQDCLWQEQTQSRDNLGWLRAQLPQALAALGWTRSQIDRLAVSHGPGALTGVRVGVGFVQGLALAWDRPLVGINTLASMQLAARQATAEQGLISVALDARMGQLYLLEQPAGLSLAELAETQPDMLIEAQAAAQRPPAAVYAGPGWEAYKASLPEGACLVPGLLPTAAAVGQLAAHAKPQPATALRIHYLREQVAQVPERLRTEAPT